MKIGGVEYNMHVDPAMGDDCAILATYTIKNGKIELLDAVKMTNIGKDKWPLLKKILN